MSEIIPTVGGDDVHLHWMREAMRMVRANPVLGSRCNLTITSGRRGNDSKGSPSRLRIYSRQ